MTTDFTVANHFSDKEPVVRNIYDRLIKALRRFGPLKEEPRKTSIHLVNHSAFAGVATRKDYLLLTIRTNYAIESPRLAKTERISRNRFHHLVKLQSSEAIDAELLRWLKDAYQLSA